jgi:hypothetical protein
MWSGDFEWETVQLPADATALLQVTAQLGKTRRQTAGAVAHAQQPCSTKMRIPLCLEQHIPRPPEVFVAFPQ